MTRRLLQHGAERLAERLITRSLRGSLRRAVWIGAAPHEAIPPGTPVVLYANHHYFHDSYLLWHLTRRVLDRRFVVWMEAWERAPLFGPIGARPFPVGDARTRAATLRRTARQMTADPATALVFYPEARLGPPDAGLQPFSADLLPRLARVFPPETRWCPVAVRLTWWGEEQPTALLTAGPAHAVPDGHEADRLRALIRHLEQVHPGEAGARLPPDAALLLDGKPADSERWDLSRLAPFYQWLER